MKRGTIDLPNHAKRLGNDCGNVQDRALKDLRRYVSAIRLPRSLPRGKAFPHCCEPVSGWSWREIEGSEHLSIMGVAEFPDEGFDEIMKDKHSVEKRQSEYESRGRG